MAVVFNQGAAFAPPGGRVNLQQSAPGAAYGGRVDLQQSVPAAAYTPPGGFPYLPMTVSSQGSSYRNSLGRGDLAQSTASLSSSYEPVFGCVGRLPTSTELASVTRPAGGREEQLMTTSALLPDERRRRRIAYRGVFLDYSLPEEVKSVAEALEQNEQEEVPFRCAAGPAGKWMFGTSGMVVVVQVALFVAALWKAECGPHSTASYPLWLWLFLVPVAVVHQVIEYYCLKYTLIPFHQVVGKFKIFDQVVNFETWLWYMRFHSLLNLSDLATDSFSAATIIAADMCPGRKLNGIWKQVIDQSIFGDLDIHIDLQYLAAVMWVLTFAQILYPLYRSVPLEAPDSWEVTASLEPGPTEYIALSGQKVTVGDTVHTMAEAVGMASLTAQGLDYPFAKEKVTRKRALAQGNQFDLKRSVFFLEAAASRVQSRVFFSGLLENVVQLNLQLTMLAISRATADSSMSLAEIQVFVSLVTSFFLTVIKLKEAFFFFSFYNMVKKAEEKEDDWTGDEEAEERFDGICAVAIRIGAVAFLLALGLIYAFLKLVAIFYCDDCLFNLTGCVHLV